MAQMKKPQYEPIDAHVKFAKILEDMLDEKGIDHNNYTQKELHQFIKDGTSISQECWEEYLLWVLYGDDKKAKTRAMLRANMSLPNAFKVH